MMLQPLHDRVLVNFTDEEIAALPDNAIKALDGYLREKMQCKLLEQEHSHAGNKNFWIIPSSEPTSTPDLAELLKAYAKNRIDTMQTALPGSGLQPDERLMTLHAFEQYLSAQVPGIHEKIDDMYANKTTPEALAACVVIDAMLQTNAGFEEEVAKFTGSEVK